jgi:hypothetical protein
LRYLRIASVRLIHNDFSGGKTHSMIALGLLAKDPELRKKVLGDENPAPNLGRCRVVGFNGRSTDAKGGKWACLTDSQKPTIQLKLRLCRSSRTSACLMAGIVWRRGAEEAGFSAIMAKFSKNL